MSFESSDFKQFDLPFDLDYLNSVDIVDSSVDAKKDDIVFISTNNEAVSYTHLTLPTKA